MHSILEIDTVFEVAQAASEDYDTFCTQFEDEVRQTARRSPETRAFVEWAFAQLQGSVEYGTFMTKQHALSKEDLD